MSPPMSLLLGCRHLDLLLSRHSMFIIASFYCFKKQANPVAVRAAIMLSAEKAGAKGLIIVSEQGVNGTIAGASSEVEALLPAIEEAIDTELVNVKHSQLERIPFRRMRVRLSKELITFGQADTDPSEQKAGTHIEPQDWNALIAKDDVILIDTRNDYEIKTGTFKGAIDPDVESFSEFAEYVRENLSPEKTPKVAMFCTGGIRCEVASAHLLNQGFREVFQLHGGILKYLEEVPEADSQWEGECFVFDGRVTVDHDLKQGSYDLCNACSWPVPLDEVGRFDDGAMCSNCHQKLSPKHQARARERWRQKQLELERLNQTTKA